MIDQKREVKLESGAVLKIQVAPFSESKALWQALLKEVKGTGRADDVMGAFKDLLCIGFSSAEIEKIYGPA